MLIKLIFPSWPNIFLLYLKYRYSVNSLFLRTQWTGSKYVIKIINHYSNLTAKWKTSYNTTLWILKIPTCSLNGICHNSVWCVIFCMVNVAIFNKSQIYTYRKRSSIFEIYAILKPQNKYVKASHILHQKCCSTL